MPDYDLNTSREALRRPRRGRGVAALIAGLVLVVVLGVAVLTLRAGTWRLDWPPSWSSAGSAERDRRATDQLAREAQQSEQVARSAAAIAQDNERLAALEARIETLNRAADDAAGRATHAESIMVAAAARRAVERGEALGYLANQLRLRFAVAQPDAVERVIAAGQRPVTLSYLSAELERLAPTLQGAPQASGWSWLRRESEELFTIRRNDRLSPDPEARLQRARLYLADHRVDMAIGEVEQLPGRDAARAWLARARDFLVASRALDAIEASAILSASPLVNATQPAGPPSARPTGATPPAPTAPTTSTAH